MKTIEIDDDVYAFIASKTQHIGESASDILRRELGVTSQLVSSTSAVQRSPQASTHELAVLLESPKLQYGSATDKYLEILGEAYRQKKADFEKIFAIKGRERAYFGRSREEITRSGRSTQPLQIPGTPYWAMTNSPTHQKQSLVREALKMLGYSEAARIAASRAVS